MFFTADHAMIIRILFFLIVPDPFQWPTGVWDAAISRNLVQKYGAWPLRTYEDLKEWVLEKFLEGPDQYGIVHAT